MTIPVYKPVENYYILYINLNKNIKQKEKQTMSKTYFNISEQKTNVIRFIKKHKDILCVDDDCKAITAKFIGELVKTNNKEFFSLANQVKLKFGQNFYIFSHDCYENRHSIEIWLPVDLSKIASDKAIKEFCDSNNFEDVIENSCFWYNMTPKRWETFEAIFDLYDKQKTPAKKTAKKTAKKAKKIVKPKEVKLSDSASLKDDIVFIDFEADEFDHLMMQYSSNIDVFIDSKSECNAKNQIDHLINAFKLAKKEADTFIELLENAKKQGAKHVVDSNYANPTEFNFTK
jgi:hypothetical protein